MHAAIRTHTHRHTCVVYDMHARLMVSKVVVFVALKLPHSLPPPSGLVAALKCSCLICFVVVVIVVIALVSRSTSSSSRISISSRLCRRCVVIQ